MRVLESKSAFGDSTETVNCRYDAKPTTLQSESELKQFFGATAEIGVMCRNYDKRSNHLDVCNQQVVGSNPIAGSSQLFIVDRGFRVGCVASSPRSIDIHSESQAPFVSAAPPAK